MIRVDITVNIQQWTLNRVYWLLKTSNNEDLIRRFNYKIIFSFYLSLFIVVFPFETYFHCTMWHSRHHHSKTESIKIQFSILRKRVFPISICNRSHLIRERIQTNTFLLLRQHDLQLKLNRITHVHIIIIFSYILFENLSQALTFFVLWSISRRPGGGGGARIPPWSSRPVVDTSSWIGRRGRAKIYDASTRTGAYPLPGNRVRATAASEIR